jgi:hypothetical protein
MEPIETASHPAQPSSKRNIIILAAIICALILTAGIYYSIKANSFCYTFAHNTRFGDNREIENPAQQATVVRKGIEYFPLDVPALQKILTKEGFTIDEFELTGGGVYFTSFYGPSTQAAVREFQKKYNLEETMWVDNGTIDKLNELYGCKAADTATSAAESASSTNSTASSSPN